MNNKYELKVVKIEKKSDDYYIIDLTKPEEFNWEAGQYAAFEIDEAIEKPFRAFSIASIPSEGLIKIGFKLAKNYSDYKNKLISLNKGDSIQIKGPMGSFKLKNDNKPIILFASGVGITPFRAFFKSLKDDRKVELIYASDSEYLFIDELEQIAKNNANITIHKTISVAETQNKIMEFVSIYENNAYYYNSGAPIVVKEIRNLLLEKNVENINIFDDYFTGY